MTVKALKSGSCARTAQLKLDLIELISRYEFETGELVSCIEFQGGDRTGTLEKPQEVEVLLDQAITEPPAFLGINPEEEKQTVIVREFDEVLAEVEQMIGMEVSCG